MSSSFYRYCAMIMASLTVIVVYLQMTPSRRWRPLPRASDTDSDIIMEHKNAKCCDAISDAILEQICTSSFTSSESNYGPPECNCVDYFYCKLVVVSSVSNNHFEEAKDMIASVQTHMPNTTLIVYSLGLKDSQVQVLRSYCNLEVRIFDFDKYPTLKYSRQNLQKYGWKPLVVQEVSDEFEVILYFDASIRLMSPNQWNVTEVPFIITASIFSWFTVWEQMCEIKLPHCVIYT